MSLAKVLDLTKLKFNNDPIKRHREKLTEDDVRLIRALSDEGLELKEIADKFEVSHSTVWKIKNRITWKSVK